MGNPVYGREIVKQKIFEVLKTKKCGVKFLSQKTGYKGSVILNVISSIPEIYEEDNGKFGIRT